MPKMVLADAYGYASSEGEIILTDTPIGSDFDLLAVEPPKPASNLFLHQLAKRSNDTKVDTTSVIGPFSKDVNVAAELHGVDGRLLHAVITAESNYNPRAVSRVGASGLMQLMPETARRYGVQNIFDPTQNIQAGAHYLSDLLKLFDNNITLAVAAYNAGENAVFRYGGKVPPYRETVNYVARVTSLYESFKNNRLTPANFRNREI